MKVSSFMRFAAFGVKTILFRKKQPILGTVIITDKCNLKCKHCSVNNITAIVHPYEKVKGEMRQLYDYLKTRENNPLKKMQALVVISKKVLTLIFTLSKKKVYYQPELVFGEYRKSQLLAA